MSTSPAPGARRRRTNLRPTSVGGTHRRRAGCAGRNAQIFYRLRWRGFRPAQPALRFPISTSNRLKGGARARPTLHQRPELGERTFEPATDEDLLQLAVGHAVLARHLGGLLDAVEPGK